MENKKASQKGGAFAQPIATRRQCSLGFRRRQRVNLGNRRQLRLHDQAAEKTPTPLPSSAARGRDSDGQILPKREKSCAQPDWAIYTKLRTARSIPKPPPQAANPTCARLAQQKRSETQKSDCAERCARRPNPTAKSKTTEPEKAPRQKRRKTAAPISAPTAMLRQLEDAPSQRFKGRFESLSLKIRPSLRKQRRQTKAPTVLPNDHEQKSRKEEGKKQGMTRKNKIKRERMEQR